MHENLQVAYEIFEKKLAAYNRYYNETYVSLRKN